MFVSVLCNYMYVYTEKSTVASRGSYVGGEWEPAWGDGNRPCEQCISLFTNMWETSKKVRNVFLRKFCLLKYKKSQNHKLYIYVCVHHIYICPLKMKKRLMRP
jgi:hypothetical protein